MGGYIEVRQDAHVEVSSSEDFGSSPSHVFHYGYFFKGGLEKIMRLFVAFSHCPGTHWSHNLMKAYKICVSWPPGFVSQGISIAYNYLLLI